MQNKNIIDLLPNWRKINISYINIILNIVTYLLHTAKTCRGGVEKPWGIRGQGENQLVNQSREKLWTKRWAEVYDWQFLTLRFLPASQSPKSKGEKVEKNGNGTNQKTNIKTVFKLPSLLSRFSTWTAVKLLLSLS